MKKQFLGNVKSAHPLAICLLIISITMIPTAWAMQSSSIVPLPQSGLINVNAVSSQLKDAIIHSSPQLLQQLITPTNTGTILHDIAKKGWPFSSKAQNDLDDIVNFLLLKGIDINVQDINGQTAFHLAVNNKQLVFATALLNQADPTLSNPVDPTLQDNDGNNILHIIAQNYAQFISKLFIINFIDTLMLQPSEKLKRLFLSTNNNNQTPAFLVNNINDILPWISKLKQYIKRKNLLGVTGIQPTTQCRPSTKPSEVIEISSSEEEQAGTWQQHDIQAGEKRRQETETARSGTTLQPPAKRQRIQPPQQGLTDKELEELFLPEVPEEHQNKGTNFRPIPPSGLIKVNIYNPQKFKNKIINAPAQFLAELTKIADYGTVLHDLAKRKIIFSDNNPSNKIIDHLKLNGIDLNAKDANGQTALHVAINNKQFIFAKVLLKKEADPTLQDNNGDNILHILAHNQKNINPIEITKTPNLDNFIRALLNKSPEIVQSLFTTSNYNNETPSFLFNSMEARNIPWLNLIKNYIKTHSISIQPPPYPSQAALPPPHNIVGLGAQHPPQQEFTIEQAEEHLLRGLKTVEEQSTEGTSSGYPQYIPSQFPQDKNGRTALHRACIKKQFNKALVLLEYKADPHLTDDFNKTCIDYIEEHMKSGQLTPQEELSLKPLLRKLEKDIEEEPPQQGQESASFGYTQPQIQTEAIDEFGRTALLKACIEKRFNDALNLLGQGANPTIQDNDGKACLDYITEYAATIQSSETEFAPLHSLLSELMKYFAQMERK